MFEGASEAEQYTESFDEGKLEGAEEGPESAVSSLEEESFSPEEKAEKKLEEEISELTESETTLDDLSEKIDELTEMGEKEHEAINNLRENPPLNLAHDPNIETVGDKALQEKQDKIKALKEKIEEQKENLLGLPEDQDFEGVEELEQYKSELNELLDGDAEMSEEEMKEERKKFIDSYINECIVEMFDHWKKELEKSENKEQAENFIARKTITLIRKKAERFIEGFDDHPELDDLSHVATLSLAWFTNEKGEEVQYITEYDIQFDNKQVEGMDEEEEKGLIGEEGQKEMQKAEEEGNLNENKQA